MNMADIVTTQDDPNDPNNPNNTSGNQNPINVGGAGGASTGTGGSSGGNPSNGQSPVIGTGEQGPGPVPYTSGGTGNGAGFTNIATAAAQNTAPNYDFIGTALGTENQNVNSAMGSAYNNFLTAAGTAPVFNNQTYNNGIFNSNQPDLGTVKNWLTASYAGPSTWDTSSFTPQYTQYKNDVAGTNTSLGLYDWLTSKAGDTPGQAQLDAASLLQNPTYQSSWGGWNNDLQRTTNAYDTYGNNATNYATGQVGAYKTLNDTTNQNLNSTINNQMTSYDNIVAANNATRQGQQDAYNSAQNESGDYGVNKGGYYSYSAAPVATLENSLSGDQVVPYNNAEGILGGSLLNPTGGWHSGAMNFDQSGYDAAVQSAKDAQDKAAAAAAVPAVQPQIIVGDSGGGGGSFICTELLRQGKITKDEIAKIHRMALKYSDTMWRGYWIWGLPTSRIMRKSKLATSIALHAFKNINNQTILGKVYIPLMFGVCAICSLFTKEEDYKDLSNLVRSGI